MVNISRTFHVLLFGFLYFLCSSSSGCWLNSLRTLVMLFAHFWVWSLTRWKMAHCALSYMCLVILTCFPQSWSTWWICLFTLCVFFIFSIKLFYNPIHLYNIIWSHSPHPTPSLLPFSLVLWPTGFNRSPHEHRCEAVCWSTENSPVATLLKTMTSPGVTNTQ